MQKSLLYLVILFLSGACALNTVPLKSNFNQTPVPPTPDYRQLRSWASLPEITDAADSVPLNSNLKNAQAIAQADVFFVYPTIFTGAPTNQYEWNADVNDVQLNHEIQTTTIMNQASVFNGACRIYSPYYRQAHLYAFYTTNSEDSKASLELAYQDIKTAFEYYLEHYNHGRPIIIASHSQGTYHAARLLKEFFDGKELQKQLVVAYLAGFPIKADAFDFIRPTEKAEETGVFASWNTFGKNYKPDNYEKYFRGSVSTNPLLWNSSEDYASRELNLGGVGLFFKFKPQLVDAQNHDGILWVSKPYLKGRWRFSNQSWHRADINFFYMNIRENVALRIEKFIAGDQLATMIKKGPKGL